MNTISSFERAFFTFIYKRHLVWYKRFILKQRPPWTEDVILQTYKIINVYRELDRCTLYLLSKLKGITNRKAILLTIIFYRFFNQDQLYEKLGITIFDKIDNALFLHIEKAFEQLKKEGKPLFSNAYLISSGTPGQKKYLSILQSLQALEVQALIDAIDTAPSPDEAFTVLQRIPMVGPFLACELWTDLSYVDFFKQHWTDNDFVHIGPGAQWGLEIIYGSPLNKVKQKEKLRHLHTIQKNVLPSIHLSLNEPLSWHDIAFKQAFSHYPFLSLTNIEGSLCEFRKYWNLSHGKGKRRYFSPLITT